MPSLSSCPAAVSVLGEDIERDYDGAPCRPSFIFMLDPSLFSEHESSLTERFLCPQSRYCSREFASPDAQLGSACSSLNEV